MVSAHGEFTEDSFQNAEQYCTDHEMPLADEKLLLQKHTEGKGKMMNTASFWIPLTRHFILSSGRVN